MSDFEEVIRVLEPYVSPPNARALLLKALRDQKLSAENFSRRDLRRIAGQLERSLSLFVGRTESARAIRQLEELGIQRSSSPANIDIITEADISTARSAARRICTEMGATSLITQKITTIVSELARNIVSYTKGGVVEIIPISAGRRRIVVRATDRGPGIPHLDVVMSGKYQSKTGLGRGLFGTKRLADSFDISTGETGTRIVAEILV